MGLKIGIRAPQIGWSVPFGLLLKPSKKSTSKKRVVKLEYLPGNESTIRREIARWLGK